MRCDQLPSQDSADVVIDNETAAENQLKLLPSS
jgi:hypothetical protein